MFESTAFAIEYSLTGSPSVPLELQRAGERGEERLLARDAAEVAAVADAVPRAEERERLVPRDECVPASSWRPEYVVVDRVGEAHLDAADGLGERGDAVELDDPADRDLHARELLDRQRRRRRTRRSSSRC